MSAPLVIVPARGGSKRIPGKNIRPFLGVPILERVVRELKNCARVGEVVVSTDDPAIERVALDAGARVPFARSPETSNDTATLHQAVTEVLTKLAPCDLPASIMCVLPTAVLVTARAIDEAVDTFAAATSTDSADSLISVQRYRHPIERALRLSESGVLRRAVATSFGARTQDLEPAFHDAGQFYLATTSGLLNRSSLMGERCLPYELSEMNAHDIDDLDDWELAEIKFRARNQRV